MRKISSTSKELIASHYELSPWSLSVRVVWNLHNFLS